MRTAIILLALLAAATPAAQETIKQDVSVEAVKTAKVGDVLLRQGAIETVKADSLGRLSTKVFSAPQWDMTGQPLIKYDEATGRIYAKSRYVQFIPDEATRELIVKREIGNAGVKEFYTVPDEKTAQLCWTVETDATATLDAGTKTLRFEGFAAPRIGISKRAFMGWSGA